MIKLFLHNNLFYYSLILIFLYFSPPIIVNFFFYNDLYFNSQIIPDLKVSLNHICLFLIFSIASLLTYKKKNHLTVLSVYLISLSIILELTHILIPYRSFEFADLFGNIIGVIIALIIILIYKKNKN